jgi:hypothetical protein
VRFQGITQDREFARCGGKKAVEEVIDLRGIDGEEGEAGVELPPRTSRRFISSSRSEASTQRPSTQRR